jgi:hypothetical protein
MRKNVRMFFAIAMLALAALACQAVSGGGDSGGDDLPVDVSTIPANNDESATEEPATEEPTTEEPISTGDVILSDDFSTEQWGVGTDVDSAVEYVNETLNFKVSTDNFFVWSTPDAEDYGNIHAEVTAINTSTDSTGAFGIICNLQITDTSYYFGVTGAGKYAITVSTLMDDTVLTNDGKWAESSLITPDADSYRIGADCGSDGILTLYVDGQKVDSVNDTTYTSGNVALFAWSGDEKDGTDVSFDDFEMAELP